MKRSEIITEITKNKFFDIKELVCKHTHEAFGEKSWQFFDKEFLEMLLVIRRDVLGMPMIVNNWHKGGSMTQRGLRCNICQLTKDKTLSGKIYMTAHANGAAIDFDVPGKTAKQIRSIIKSKSSLLPCNVRCEADVTWVHIDIYDNGSNIKYSEFNSK